MPLSVVSKVADTIDWEDSTCCRIHIKDGFYV